MATFTDVHSGVFGVTAEQPQKARDRAGHPTTEVYQLPVEV